MSRVELARYALAVKQVSVGLDEALTVVRKHWRCRTDACRSRVMDDLRADAEQAEAILRALIAEGKADHRAWAMWTARQVLPKAQAASVLEAAIARERRHDQVDIAFGELRYLDLELVRPHLPRLRRRLAGTDWHTMVFVFWLMADLRDADSLPAIERTMQRALGNNMPYIAKLGSVVTAVIQGEEAQILWAIRAHDHDRMRWLVQAARRMDTPAAQETLDACATSDFDLDCRIECRVALLQGQTPTNEIDYDEIRRQLRSEFGAEAVPDPPPARMYLHDRRGLKSIEELRHNGERTVVYERPPGLVERLLDRLRRRMTK